MRKSILISTIRILLISMIICVIPLQVSAEDIYNGYILNTDYVLTFVPYSGFNNTTIAHLNNALYEWNEAVGFTLMLREPTLRHSQTNYPSNDNKSYVYKVDDGRSYIGATALFNTPFSNVLKSVDINFNTNYTFVNNTYYPDDAPNTTGYDVWSVFVHEAGHAAGLGDLSERGHCNCVMYGAIDTGEIRRYRTNYDATNIQNLYV